MLVFKHSTKDTIISPSKSIIHWVPGECASLTMMLFFPSVCYNEQNKRLVFCLFLFLISV